MAWYRVDSDASGPFTARECAAAGVWAPHSPSQCRILLSNGNDATMRFKDLLVFDPGARGRGPKHSGSGPRFAPGCCGSAPPGTRWRASHSLHPCAIPLLLPLTCRAVTLVVEKFPQAQNPSQIPVSAHTFSCCDKRGRYFYQMGGWDGSRDVATMFRFDAAASTWSNVVPVGDVPSARHFHTCIGLGPRLILFGGYDGSRWVNDLYSFDPVTVSWKREVPLPGPVGAPAPRASHHAVAIDGTRMAVFAGFDGERAPPHARLLAWRVDCRHAARGTGRVGVRMLRACAATAALVQAPSSSVTCGSCTPCQ